MPERRHRTPLDEFYTAVALSPLFEPLKAEADLPAELARDRRERALIGGAKAVLGAEMVHQNNLAAGPGDAREFVERRFRVRYRGDDILRDDDVERRVLKS